MTKPYHVKVTIEEMRILEVDANSPEEAEGIVEEMVVDRANFNDVQIYDTGDLETVEIVDIKVRNTLSELEYEANEE